MKLIDYIFAKLKEFAVWAKEYFKKDKPVTPPVDPVPTEPPVVIVEPPVKPDLPVVEPPRQEKPSDFGPPPIPVPPPVVEPPKPQEPEAPQWGYNGFPQTDGNISLDKDSQHQYLWMVNGNPYMFTVHVPEGKRMVEMQCRSTPRMGYPDPFLHQHEVKSGSEQYPVGGANFALKLGPGTHFIVVESVGFTGGTIWQFRYG